MLIHKSINLNFKIIDDLKKTHLHFPLGIQLIVHIYYVITCQRDQREREK